jgi:hypothetical protein
MMALTGIKSSLKLLNENLDIFPRLRNSALTHDRNHDIQWLLIPQGKMFGFGIRGNGNVVIQDKGERNTYTFETFFLKPRITSCQEKEVIESISDYMLLIEMKHKTLKARDITRCKNAEIRRQLLEGFGYEKFVEQMGGQTIHVDGDYKLIKIDWHKDEEPIKLVRVKDSSTDRWYILRVPPEVRTCKQALAWTFGLEPEQYHPVKET